jgi:uncharacterized membrane protein
MKGEPYMNVFKTILSRFRSWAVWLAIAALVVFCVKEFVGVDIAQQVDGFLNVLLPVLMAFGIINDPTNPNGL